MWRRRWSRINADPSPGHFTNADPDPDPDSNANANTHAHADSDKFRHP